MRRRDAGKVASSLPFLWPSISDVVHLNGVQETLEVLNQGGSPISPALGVGEDQQGPNWHLAQILVEDCVEVESICGGWTQERGGYSEMKGVVVGLVEQDTGGGNDELVVQDLGVGLLRNLLHLLEFPLQLHD